MYKNGSLLVSYVKINDTCYKHSIIEGKVNTNQLSLRIFTIR